MSQPSTFYWRLHCTVYSECSGVKYSERDSLHFTSNKENPKRQTVLQLDRNVCLSVYACVPGKGLNSVLQADRDEPALNHSGGPPSKGYWRHCCRAKDLDMTCGALRPWTLEVGVGEGVNS